MMIWREYTFEAAHSLPHVAEGHKCARMHGHSYRVRVEVTGYLGKIGQPDDGMVIDFADVDAIVKPIVEGLDHRVLNEIEGLGNPTSENLAEWFACQIGKPLPFRPFQAAGSRYVSAVEVSETARSGCRWER